MLGFLVERITGRSMDEYVKNEIYKPLGLKRTTYLPLANGFTTEDVAATSFGNPYEYAMVDEIDYPGFGYDCTADLDAFRTFTGWRNYTLQGECNDGNAWMANGGVAGHAGLYSDAEDLAVLCQAMLNGGIYKGVRLYKKEVIDEFTSEQNGKPSRGLGFERGLVHGPRRPPLRRLWPRRLYRHPCGHEQDQQDRRHFPDQQAERRLQAGLHLVLQPL